MTNQTQVSAELSEADLEAMGDAYERSANANRLPWGHGRRYAIKAAWLASPGPAMATLITEMQADMSGKTVMSEEAFRDLHGKAERLSALEAERDALRKALEPFARVADKIRDEIPGAVCAWAQEPLFKPGGSGAFCHVADFRRARQALTGAPDHE